MTWTSRRDARAFPVCLRRQIDRARKGHRHTKMVVHGLEHRGIGAASGSFADHGHPLDGLEEIIGEIFGAEKVRPEVRTKAGVNASRFPGTYGKVQYWVVESSGRL